MRRRKGGVSVLGELAVEEWAELRRLRVADDVDTLVLTNDAGKTIDERVLPRRLARIKGVERIRSLVVEPNSRVRTLEFIKALPKLDNLELYGLQLQSLVGLRLQPRWLFVNVDTGRNRKRSLDALEDAEILRLSVRWGNEGDVKAIGGNSTVVDLTLSNWPELSLTDLRRMPLENLTLVSGNFDEFGDAGIVRDLRFLRIVDCRKLQALTGDNGNVTWLMIETCNRLDLTTVTTFRNLETLEVSSIRHPIPLSIFRSLHQLRCLSIDNASVHIDIENLKDTAVELEELSITNIRKSGLLALSKANQDVIITNGLTAFRNGRPAALNDNLGEGSGS